MGSTPPILWEPDTARIERATITRYARWLAESGGVRTSGYHDLWRWSVTELEAGASGALSPKPTRVFEELPVGLVFRSVGYKGVPLPDVPFHESWG